jgi:hypothetical protein
LESVKTNQYHQLHHKLATRESNLICRLNRTN